MSRLEELLAGTTAIHETMTLRASTRGRGVGRRWSSTSGSSARPHRRG